jgi:hypothetical protein
MKENIKENIKERIERIRFAYRNFAANKRHVAFVTQPDVQDVTLIKTLWEWYKPEATGKQQKEFFVFAVCLIFSPSAFCDAQACRRRFVRLFIKTLADALHVRSNYVSRLIANIVFLYALEPQYYSEAEKLYFNLKERLQVAKLI